MEPRKIETGPFAGQRRLPEVWHEVRYYNRLYKYRISSTQTDRAWLANPEEAEEFIIYLPPSNYRQLLEVNGVLWCWTSEGEIHYLTSLLKNNKTQTPWVKLPVYFQGGFGFSVTYTPLSRNFNENTYPMVTLICPQTVWRFYPTERSVKLVTFNSHSLQEHTATLISPERLIVIGGRKTSPDGFYREWSQRLYQFNPVTSKWVAWSKLRYEPRRLGQSKIEDEYIVLFGGLGPDGEPVESQRFTLSKQR